jgi:hypothetical protein
MRQGKHLHSPPLHIKPARKPFSQKLQIAMPKHGGVQARTALPIEFVIGGAKLGSIDLFTQGQNSGDGQAIEELRFVLAFHARVVQRGAPLDALCQQPLVVALRNVGELRQTL